LAFAGQIVEGDGKDIAEAKKENAKKGATFCGVEASCRRDILCSSDGMPMESSPVNLQFGEYPALIFSAMG